MKKSRMVEKLGKIWTNVIVFFFCSTRKEYSTLYGSEVKKRICMVNFKLENSSSLDEDEVDVDGNIESDSDDTKWKNSHYSSGGAVNEGENKSR